MGLKTTNYEIKELGMTLPEAYAIIHELRISGNDGTAIFHVQNSPRVNAIDLKPFQKTVVRFKWDRTENPLVSAYRRAKEVDVEKHYNETTREFEDVEIPQPFHGWEDDIESDI